MCLFSSFGGRNHSLWLGDGGNRGVVKHMHTLCWCLILLDTDWLLGSVCCADSPGCYYIRNFCCSSSSLLLRLKRTSTLNQYGICNNNQELSFFNYEGYKYVINRRGRVDRIFWRCAKSRSCSGGLTSINSEIVSTRANEHSHPPHLMKLKWQLAKL